MISKKFLPVFLAMTMLASFAGCGSTDTKTTSAAKETKTEETKKKDVTLTVWHQYLPEVQKQLEESFKEFTDKTGIKVKFEKQEDFDNKVELATQSGELPDLIIGSCDGVGKLSVMEAIQPIDDLISKDDLTNTIDTAVSGFTYDDKLYGAPGHLETVTLIYNKDLIKEAPKTMDELLQKANELTKNGQYGFLIPPRDGYFNSCFFNGSNKNKYLTDDGKAALNTPENVETIKYLQKLTAKFPKDLDNQMVSKFFDDGKAAMMISGPWDIAKLKELKVNYGLALIPTTSDGKPAAPYVSVQGMMMTTGCKDKEAAAEAMKYYLSDKVAMAYFKAGGYMPANKTIYDKEEVKTDTDLLAFKAQSEVGVAVPNIPEMGVMWTPAGDFLQDAIVLKQDAQASADKFQKRAEEVIANMK